MVQHLVRRAVPTDADALVRLGGQLAYGHEPARGGVERVLEAFGATESRALWVVELDGAVSGYLAAHSLPAVFGGFEFVHVEELVVSESKRGQGLGTVLLRAAEGWASARGARYVQLATSRAQAFYEARGYEGRSTLLKKRCDERP